VIGFFNETKGSGPRRAITEGNTLWVLHELDNTLTERNLPIDGRVTIPTISTVVTIPAGRDSASESGAYHAAELLRPKPNTAFPTEYLYVSNRAIKTPDPLGDTIAIFSTKPLKKVGEIHTGLDQIRGMEFGGENDKYLIAGGNGGGGVVVYERVDGGKDLKLLARNWEAGSVQRTTFLWW
jgi:6-phosphogluconolactonase (cycloisomerase 2 family)